MSANPEPSTEDGRVIVQTIIDQIANERVKLDRMKARFEAEQVRRLSFSTLIHTLKDDLSLKESTLTLYSTPWFWDDRGKLAR